MTDYQKNELPPRLFVVGKLYSLRPGDYTGAVLDTSSSIWNDFYRKDGSNDVEIEDVEPVLILTVQPEEYMAIGLLKDRTVFVHIYDVRDNL